MGNQADRAHQGALKDALRDSSLLTPVLSGGMPLLRPHGRAACPPLSRPSHIANGAQSRVRVSPEVRGA